MRNFKKWQIYTLLLVTTTFTAFANTSSETAKPNQKKAVSPAVSKATSTVQVQLDNAKKAGNATFVVVTSTGNLDTPKALSLANKAKAKYQKAVVIEMDRDNASNASLVSKWQLSGAPLPLILVISPKGAAVGGFVLSDATVENLINVIPSPKEDDVYVALSNKKAVFVVVGKKSNTDRTAILESCKAANTQLRGGAAIVEIDPTDIKEKKFLNMLNASNVSSSTNIFVFNTSGQATGTFSGKAETASLVAAARKVIRSGGCCPGGAPAGGCGAK